MPDDRLANFAAKFTKELTRYGLISIPFQQNEAEADGWWTPVAKWPGNRPRVGLFFDRILGDAQPRFWFGFYSTHPRISKLSAEAPSEFQPKIELTDNDLQDNGQLNIQARTRVMQNSGLIIENYTSEHTSYFGKYDVEFLPDDRLIQVAVRFVVGIVEHIQPDLNLEVDINEIKRRNDINGTTRKQLIDARKGQGQFRRDLLARWGGCSVTGCNINEVLRASHIKPWKSSTDQERLDVNNGLLLVATLDALFDRGLVSFKDSGEIIISSRVNIDEVSLVMHPEKRNLRNELSDAQRRYLAGHRREVFQD